MSIAVDFRAAPVLPARGAAGVSIGDAVRAVCLAKERANCRPSYVRSLRQYLGQFARGREGWPLAAFTVDVIERWFDERGEPHASRASNTGRLAALFSFAVRRDWLPRNPCGQLEKVRIDRKPPASLTPLQCALVMDYARRRKPRQLAFYTLALFAGVRPDELSRLSWEAVNLDDGTMTVDAAASKVRRRRIVPLEPEAIRWLRLAKERGGRLPVKRMTRRRYLDQARRVLGLERWPQDVLRHTAASYLLARHQDAGKVALWLGNSARILETNYKALVSAKDCAAFWAFTPESPRPVKPKAAVPAPSPVRLPVDWGMVIDPTWTRFARAEAALKMEPALRALGRRNQRTGSRCASDRVDTIAEMGRVAGCSRQTMQFVKVIVRLADPDVVDGLRKGSLSIAGVYKRVVAETV